MDIRQGRRKPTWWLVIIVALALPHAAPAAQPEDAATSDAEAPPTDEAERPPANPPAPPQSVTVRDHPHDGGDRIDVTFGLSPDDLPEDEHRRIPRYVIEVAGEDRAYFREAVAAAIPEPDDYEDREMTVTVEGLVRGEPYYVRVRAIGAGGRQSDYVGTTEPVVPTMGVIDGGRMWTAVLLFAICGAVIAYIAIARRGRPLKVRKIAGLEAVDEAVGRATEMGRSCLFIPGIQDMNDIQTIAGITILSRVARTAAEYDAKVEVPTSRALVMTTARETVQSSFVQAGRPDAFHQDHIYYVTDEQFGYVAYLSGMMVREKPAACFYMGSFFAESLILAETGNSIGAIQVAGTAQPAQLPFFVAACDYTLIGEEFFAASAYLSGDPDQLGSLKGQDVGKLIVGVLIVIGCVLSTLAAEELTGSALAERFRAAAEYLRDVVLQAG